MGKSVFFRNRQRFGYGYGEKSRAPDQTNQDKGILKVNENLETGDERKVLGIISIRVDDLLISGSSEFSEYISWGGEREI